MFCLQCGEPNPGNAVRCGACGAVLESVPAVVDQPFARKMRASWEAAPAGLKAVLSLCLGILGALVMRPALALGASFLLLVLALLLAVSGISLGFHTLRTAATGRSPGWCRPTACGGVMLSVGVAAVPVVALIVALVSFPRRMMTEPLAITNMRHLSMAVQGYMEDNGGVFPGWVSGPDGRAYHNVWDQQIFPYAKYNAIYQNGLGAPGIRSPSQPSPHNRVLTYALNGLLITRMKPQFDGNADWAAGPLPAASDSISDPAKTIVFAEVATDAPMGGIYAQVQLPPPDAEPSSEASGDSARPAGTAPRAQPVVETRAYRHALAQWIDIDPRAWVETRGPVKSYTRGQWDPDRGVGRELHAGGACYAFVDGHVEYMRLRATVTGGQVGVPSDTFWSPTNAGNMWNPQR